MSETAIITESILKQKPITSYEVFLQHVDTKTKTTSVTSKDCYELWIQTRRDAPKHPEESFRKALTAHLTGSDGRRPFPKEIETIILDELRKGKTWDCFQGTKYRIGQCGFKPLAYHEKVIRSKAKCKAACGERSIKFKKSQPSITKHNNLNKRRKITALKTKLQEEDCVALTEVGLSKEPYFSEAGRKRGRDELTKLAVKIHVADSLHPSWRRPMDMDVGAIGEANNCFSLWTRDLHALEMLKTSFGIDKPGIYIPASCERAIEHVYRNFLTWRTPEQFKLFCEYARNIDAVDPISRDIIYVLNNLMWSSIGTEKCGLEIEDPRVSPGFIQAQESSFDPSSPIGRAVYSYDTLVIEDTDEIGEQIYTYPLRGRTCFSNCHPAQVFMCLVNISQGLESSKNHAWTRYLIRTSNGSYKAILSRITMRTFGNKQYYFEEFQDISQRYRHLIDLPTRWE